MQETPNQELIAISQPKGLRNEGNNCFLNCAIQCLACIFYHVQDIFLLDKTNKMQGILLKKFNQIFGFENQDSGAGTK